MYRDPVEAFAGISSDHSTITIEDLLKHQVLLRAKLNTEDVKFYLLQEIFNSESFKLDYQQFKKFFFPSLVNINEHREWQLNLEHVKTMQKFDQQPADFVKNRLKKLDGYIRSKVSEKWVSVRQAFLDFDLDHDGFI